MVKIGKFSQFAAQRVQTVPYSDSFNMALLFLSRICCIKGIQDLHARYWRVAISISVALNSFSVAHF